MLGKIIHKPSPRNAVEQTETEKMQRNAKRRRNRAHARDDADEYCGQQVDTSGTTAGTTCITMMTGLESDDWKKVTTAINDGMERVDWKEVTTSINDGPEQVDWKESPSPSTTGLEHKKKLKEVTSTINDGPEQNWKEVGADSEDWSERVDWTTAWSVHFRRLAEPKEKIPM
jgi:hypothetical protein